jgi:hypothetical protein
VIDWQDTKNSHVILRAEVGSRLYGTNLDDSGDRDELGICVEPVGLAMGFSEFEQYLYRTASEREGTHDARSQTGDLDLTIYSLRKFLRLALKGNPTIIQLLFVRQRLWVCGDARGQRLQELTPYLLSRAAGGSFLGYLQAQRMRFTGERGGSHGATHSEDYERFGYDTKSAMHMLRLGYQGVELLSEGKLTFPVPERDFLLHVRKGQSSPQEILSRTGELEKEIKGLLETSPLPKQPDRDYVEDWMIKTYWTSWKAQASNPMHELYDAPKDWLNEET